MAQAAQFPQRGRRRVAVSPSPGSWGGHRHGLPEVAAPVRGRPLAGLAMPRVPGARGCSPPPTGGWLATRSSRGSTGSWISVRDSQFAVRAARGAGPVRRDLGHGWWQLRKKRATWICADEEDLHPGPSAAATPPLPPGKARTMRVEHDDDRGGALAYLVRLGCPPRQVHLGSVRGHRRDRAVLPAGRARSMTR